MNGFEMALKRHKTAVTLILLTEIVISDSSLVCPRGNYVDQTGACVSCAISPTTHSISFNIYCEGMCSIGWRELDCDTKCGNCVNYICNRWTGRCLHGCLTGYHGDRCNIECANCLHCDTDETCACVPGYHGDRCQNACPSNCRNSTCTPKGFCHFGCTRGWVGDKCDIRCPHCEYITGLLALCLFLVLTALLLYILRKCLSLCFENKKNQWYLSPIPINSDDSTQGNFSLLTNSSRDTAYGYETIEFADLNASGRSTTNDQSSDGNEHYQPIKNQVIICELHTPSIIDEASQIQPISDQLETDSSASADIPNRPIVDHQCNSDSCNSSHNFQNQPMDEDSTHDVSDRSCRPESTCHFVEPATETDSSCHQIIKEASYSPCLDDSYSDLPDSSFDE